MSRGLSAGHFEWHEPPSWLEPSGRLALLAQAIELAIESGDPRSLDAVEAAIDLLDAIEGDPDLEPCPAGDDGCHYFRDGYGREGWGSVWYEPGVAPTYGVDQAEGPLTVIGARYPGWADRSKWGA